ncbi:MAG: type II toxin-antitoxin system HicB family antitoxin [Amaricoccus sp.]|uniref:type II toxin-antitoxin system HicB family antitoxin n=1 Tax=Amaricoccus sp. TaxID=1872485 RepID=UPI0039E2F5B0
MISYPVTLEPDDNGTLLATCPDLPGVVTYGENETDALRHAAQAIEEWLGQALHAFAPIPRPSGGAPRATLSLNTTLVLELYWALSARGWTRADLQRALGWHRPQVDRLFDLRHETKSVRLEAAFRALGVEPHVDVRRAA